MNLGKELRIIVLFFLAAAMHDPAFGQQVALTFDDLPSHGPLPPGLTRAVYGRDIKHVLLLHIGAFQTVMLPRLMALLKEKGFGVISLNEAETDEAYRSAPVLRSGWEGTLLDQMMRAKGLKAPTQPELPMAKLDSVCR